MFDDDSEDIGQEIEAFCPRCKADATHVVVSRYEDEIRRVKCNTCEDVHAFRRPRGEEAGDEPPEPPVKKKAQKARPTWEQVMGRKKKEARAYNGNEVFHELDIIDHPTFGIGFVSELIGQDKIEVTFQNDKRILVHNRQGLSLHLVSRPPEPPRESKPKAPERGARAQKAVLPPRHEDLPDLAGELPEELPDLMSASTLKSGKPPKLSPKALAALEDEDEEPEDLGEEEDGGGRRCGRAEKGAKAARGRRAAADGEDIEEEQEAKPERPAKAARPQKEARGAPAAAPPAKAARPQPVPKPTRPEKEVKAAPAAKPAPAAKARPAPDVKPAAARGAPAKPAAAATPARSAAKARPVARAKAAKSAAKARPPARPAAKVRPSKPAAGGKPAAGARPAARAKPTRARPASSPRPDKRPSPKRPGPSKGKRR